MPGTTGWYAPVLPPIGGLTCRFSTVVLPCLASLHEMCASGIPPDSATEQRRRYPAQRLNGLDFGPVAEDREDATLSTLTIEETLICRKSEFFHQTGPRS
jgi:hypothetical protein